MQLPLIRIYFCIDLIDMIFEELDTDKKLQKKSIKDVVNNYLFSMQKMTKPSC